MKIIENYVTDDFLGICKIIKIVNLQQKANDISGAKNRGYAYLHEGFCVTTHDGGFQKIYGYNEASTIISDLYKWG